MLSHVLIFHGRRTCHAKKPACGACPIARLCPSYGLGETDPVKADKLLKFELAPGATNPYAASTPVLPGSPTAGASAPAGQGAVPPGTAGAPSQPRGIPTSTGATAS